MNKKQYHRADTRGVKKNPQKSYLISILQIDTAQCIGLPVTQYIKEGLINRKFAHKLFTNCEFG